MTAIPAWTARLQGAGGPRLRLGGQPRVASLVIAALLGAGPAAAADLISFTDNAPNFGESVEISKSRLWAEGWTQTVSSANVDISVLLAPSRLGAGRWWVATALGAGATPADVVASGDFTTPNSPSFAIDFNGLPLTVLATGLNFGPGTYYLVLEGPDRLPLPPVNWAGDATTNVTANLAPGFTAMSALHSEFLVYPDPFGPASTFVVPASAITLDFQLHGEVSGGGGSDPIPEPTSWMLMITGFALVGAAMRRWKAGRAVPRNYILDIARRSN